jgi:hypothetical protein
MPRKTSQYIVNSIHYEKAVLEQAVDFRSNQQVKKQIIAFNTAYNKKEGWHAYKVRSFNIRNDSRFNRVFAD